MGDENDTATHIWSADKRGFCALGFGSEWGCDWCGCARPTQCGQLRELWRGFLRYGFHRPGRHWSRLLWAWFLRSRKRSLAYSDDPFYLLSGWRRRSWHRLGTERPVSTMKRARTFPGAPFNNPIHDFSPDSPRPCRRHGRLLLGNHWFARLSAGGSRIRTIGTASCGQGFERGSCCLRLISRRRKSRL